MTDQPILCAWTGEEMRPVNGLWAKRADQQWVIGEKYMVEIRHERSSASHRQYFAAINECWQNLPAALAAQFPDPERLRKYALCMTGYRDERSIVCSSRAEARRIAAFIAPMDDYAIVSVNEAVVVVWTAKSQSTRAMGKAQFQASKEAVLEFLASLIGTTPGALERAVA